MTDASAVAAGRPTPTRVIAINLPQYHPIPENDRWWGRGFTEWTNVAKARPLYPGHEQPQLPADLGFYDLRLPEARAAQAEMARAYGVDGFCYYHYWFNGHRLLERPVDEVVASGEPDFPFCLCWANENWSRRWDGLDQEMLIEQRYSAEDDVAHLRSLIPTFSDRRYIRVGGKPLFLVYNSAALPDARATTDRWRAEAERAGLPGLYLVRVESHNSYVDPSAGGFDAALEFQPLSRAIEAARMYRFKWWQRSRLGTQPRVFRDGRVFDYQAVARAAAATPYPAYPWVRSACPAWDNAARRKEGATTFHGSTPAAFGRWMTALLEQARHPAGEPLVFVNAWNEWAEGNHLEPDQRWGLQYLEALRRAVAEHAETAAAPAV